jgi:hypothetical protein
MENGKIRGFKIEETAEDRRRGRSAFSQIPLPAGISREDVERRRANWPLATRHRKFVNPTVDKIKAVILREGSLSLITA